MDPLPGYGKSDSGGGLLLADKRALSGYYRFVLNSQSNDSLTERYALLNIDPDSQDAIYIECQGYI